MSDGKSDLSSQDRANARRQRAISLEADFVDPPDTGLAKFLVLLGLAAVFGALVWAYLAPLKEVVVGQGRILPARQIHILQHQDGGRIASVFAREGDLVEAGDRIVQFDRSDERGLVSQLVVREDAISAELTRVRAFAEGRPYSQSEGNTSTSAVVSAQIAVYDIQSEARQARINVLRGDVDLAQARLRETEALISHLSRREEIEARRLDDIERLSGSVGLVTRRDRDLAEIELIETRADLSSALTRKQTATLDLRRANYAIAEFEVQERRTALELASDLEARLAETRQEIERRDAIAAREHVLSPYRGRIQSMSITGPDQFLQPGGTVAALVPENQELVAELTVSADRIGSIAPGSPVSIKVLTFDFTRFGTISGEVIDVSPTSDIGTDGALTYRVRVGLSKDHVGSETAGLSLRPGLAVVGDIVLGQRTVMEYFLKPLRVAKDRALTEI